MATQRPPILRWTPLITPRSVCVVPSADVGRAAIEEFFVSLYSHPEFTQRTVFKPTEIAEIVFVRPDVAVARTFLLHGNQKQADGTIIAERRSHQTMTLTREQDGWKVRYEIVTDERDRPQQN